MKKIVFLTLLLIISVFVHAQREYSDSDVTKVVMLGTGNPNPDPEHSGNSVAVVVNDTPYIFDFGPGMVRKAAAMSPRWGGTIEGLDVKNLKYAFLSHLHSDHTIGYPDLILTPWTMGRDEPLEVYGPEGLKKMTENILEAYQEDIRYRLYGYEPANNKGWRVVCHEITEDGEVYRDSNIVVEAFSVPHGTWPDSWAYKIITPDKKIVISGDCAPNEKMAEYAKGIDLLIHEVYYKKGYDTKTEFWRNYHAINHTSTFELGELLKKAQPEQTVLYHTLFWGGTEEDILKEIGQVYKGSVIVSRDLDIF